MFFLKIAEEYVVDQYASATTKQESSEIVQAIVCEIEAGGGFIQLDPTTGTYFQAAEGVGRAKTKQDLRYTKPLSASRKAN